MLPVTTLLKFETGKTTQSQVSSTQNCGVSGLYHVTFGILFQQQKTDEDICQR